MYITIYEIDHQSKYDAWIRALQTGALGQPWGMGWGGRWEGDSGWGTHVHPCLIHVNVWQNQYSTVKQNEVKIKIKNESACNAGGPGSIPGLWRSPGEGKGYLLQYSGLENSMDCSTGSQRVRHDWVTFTFTFALSIHLLMDMYIASMSWLL